MNHICNPFRLLCIVLSGCEELAYVGGVAKTHKHDKGKTQDR